MQLIAAVLVQAPAFVPPHPCHASSRDPGFGSERSLLSVPQ
jgi:hypothetical protein